MISSFLEKLNKLTCSLAILLTAAYLGCQGCSNHQDRNDVPGINVKNVILLISDGCGYNQLKAANYYLGVEKQAYEDFPLKCGMSTYCYNQSYDTNAAWSDFSYVTSNYTDSAAAATVMSTGQKSAYGYLGYNYDGTIRLKHAMEYAAEKGFSTGVVTSVQLCHATPAGFVAHNLNRNDYTGIAQEMINLSPVTVIMGCGHPFFDQNGNFIITSDFQYVGGETTWNDLKSGNAGNTDANHDGLLDIKDKWQLIQKKDEFEALAQNPDPACDRICGVAQVATTLQYARTQNNTTDVYGDPFLDTVPSLATMAKGALNTLHKNPHGFFLMVESGAVDLAAHANASNRVIEEEIEFNKAVNAVLEWVAQYADWNETLVIVTGDHETGYLLGPGSNPGREEIVNNGQGQLPGMAWFSSGHTNSLIPFFAKGKNSKLFASQMVGTDLIRGAYLDNTSLGKMLVNIYK